MHSGVYNKQINKMNANNSTELGRMQCAVKRIKGSPDFVS